MPPDKARYQPENPYNQTRPLMAYSARIETRHKRGSSVVSLKGLTRQYACDQRARPVIAVLVTRLPHAERDTDGHDAADIQAGLKAVASTEIRRQATSRSVQLPVS